MGDKIALHDAKIAKNKEYLDVVNLAKDGKISKEALVKYSNAMTEVSVSHDVEELAKVLKNKLPHDGIKKAGIYGAIAAGIGVVATMFLNASSNKKTNKA